MTWLSNNLEWIAQLTGLHIFISVSAILLSLVIAIPVGWIANRRKLTREAIIALIGVIYAVPSLPMLIVIPVLTGAPLRSSLTVIIVLSIYGVALLTRTVADAFLGVSPEVVRSAVALGFSGWRRFWQVELPLAGPVILAGLRVVVANTVSLVTVGAVVGIQSIGTLFTDGFQRGIIVEVVAGLVLTIILALLLDGAVVLAGKLIFPWTRSTRAKTDPAAELKVESGASEELSSQAESASLTRGVAQ